MARCDDYHFSDDEDFDEELAKASDDQLMGRNSKKMEIENSSDNSSDESESSENSDTDSFQWFYDEDDSWCRKLKLTNDIFEEIENVNQEGHGDDADGEPYLKFKLLGKKESSIFHGKRKTTKFNFSVSHNLAEFRTNLLTVEKRIDEGFEKVFNEVLPSQNPSDYVSGYVRHSELNEPIFIGVKRRSDFRIEKIFTKIASVCQSNDRFLLDGEFEFEINITDASSGSGNNRKTRKTLETPEEKAYANRSIVQIKNNDNLCLPRAIAVGRFKADMDGLGNNVTAAHKREYHNIVRQDRDLRQKSEAIKLCEDSKISNYSSKVFDIEDVHRFQEYLKEYKIIVFDGVKYEKLYEGSPKSFKRIYIQYIPPRIGDRVNTGHFNTIVNIKAFMGCREYCLECHQIYRFEKGHSCTVNCDRCFTPYCKKDNENEIYCGDCNRSFKGDVCYDMHIKKKVCRNRKVCEICTRDIFEDKDHDCKFRTCSKCNESYSEERHFCYINPLDIKEVVDKDKKVAKIFVFFDIEAYQRVLAESVKEVTKIHEPNLLISYTFCDKCWDSTALKKNCNFCEVCETGVQQFRGKGCVGAFVEKLVELAKKKKKHQFRVFAHNGKGYDFQFVIAEILKLGLPPDVTMTGCKILKIDLGPNVRFLDTLLFLMAPLAALPKGFGIENCVAKGYFPHDFNTSYSLDYVGEIPAKDDFGCEYMKPAVRKDFERWYEANKNAEYNFRVEILKYCFNDVVILAKCSMMFRAHIIKTRKLDPFTDSFTLPMLNMKINRTLFYPAKAIGITPVNGYAPQGNYSNIAMAWLDYMEESENIEIEREVPIGPFTVDGFCKDTNTVYEFYGCFWHGHQCKGNKNRDKGQKPGNQLLRETEAREEILRRLDYSMVTVWECELKAEGYNDENMSIYINGRLNFYKKLKEVGRLNPRNALFGGRTENFKFVCDLTDNDDETIQYFDVNGLYPDVMKRNEYPIGHPKVITKNFKPIDQYFGLVLCAVLPPQNIKYGALPKKVNKKLVFPSCVKCAAEEDHGDCNCSVKERAIVGTWVISELIMNLKIGYKLLEIYEINHYEQRSKTLFEKPINVCLKEKQEASGYPNASYINNPSKQDQYLRDVKIHNGFELEKAKIENNPTARTFAKNSANGQWGKLGQRTNLPKTEFCYQYCDYMKIVLDKSLKLVGEYTFTDNDMVMVSYIEREPKNVHPGLTSSTIAAFVTSYARQHLFSIFQEINRVRQDRLLYADTDSVMFVQNSTDPPLRNVGPHGGQLTNEIVKDYGQGAVCKRAVFAGPKSYAYEVTLADGTKKTTMKIKGLTLHSLALSKIDMDKVEELIKETLLEKKNNKISVPQMQFRTSKDFKIKTVLFNKLFRVCSTKRKIVGLDTVPFGYKSE